MMATLLADAAATIRERDQLAARLRSLDENINRYCREYDHISGTRGLRPESLRKIALAQVT